MTLTPSRTFLESSKVEKSGLSSSADFLYIKQTASNHLEIHANGRSSSRPCVVQRFGKNDQDKHVQKFRTCGQDSLSIQREVEAVKEFLHVEQAHFHVMRDHPWHKVPILAGTWAAKLYQPSMRAKLKRAFDKVMKDKRSFAPRTEKGADQQVLGALVYPLVKKEILAHDSFSCTTFVNSRYGHTYRGYRFCFLSLISDLSLRNELTDPLSGWASLRLATKTSQCRSKLNVQSLVVKDLNGFIAKL